MKMIDAINQLRTNPKSFIPYVEHRLNGIFVLYKESTIELLSTLKKMKPIGSVEFDPEMYEITKMWGDKLEMEQKMYHGDLYNRFIKINTRNLKYGVKNKGVSENLASLGNMRGASEAVIGVIIDLLVDGSLPVEKKGHRHNLLDPTHTKVSVRINNFVCVQNFK